jgi:ABC-type tungstate transport system substrate-binding protein
MRDAAVARARSAVVVREAYTSVPTIRRGLLILLLLTTRGGVDYLTVHVGVVAVVASKGERRTGVANKADE